MRIFTNKAYEAIIDEVAESAAKVGGRTGFEVGVTLSIGSIACLSLIGWGVHKVRSMKQDGEEVNTHAEVHE